MTLHRIERRGAMGVRESRGITTINWVSGNCRPFPEIAIRELDFRESGTRLSWGSTSGYQRVFAQGVIQVAQTA